MTLVEEVSRAENISRDSVSGTSLTPSVIRELFELFQSINRRLQDLYDGAIRISATKYDRQEIAEIWKDLLKDYKDWIIVIERMRANAKIAGLKNFDIDSTIMLLHDLIEACQEHYEFHA
jgi:hypothetical protein